MKISASIIVFNEEDNIEGLLASIDWVDEIVIVDSFSTDRTKELASKYTAAIYDHEFKGFKDKHEHADSLVSNEWILWMDADERVTPELRDEIIALRERSPADLPDGFEIPRRTWFAGKWIAHSGWYPDRQMRLYKKSASYWDGVAPHETARVRGRVERLKGHLLHDTKRDLSEYHRTIDSYTSLAAEALEKRYTKRISGTTIAAKSIGGFLRTYLAKQGFRDGIQGLLIAGFTAYGVFLKYSKLWERQSRAK